MTKKNKSNPSGRSGNWKNLAPKTSRRPASKAARRKRLMGISRFLGIILVIGALGFVGWFFQQQVKPESGPIDFTGAGVPIANLQFESDGVLHRNWFKNWFGPMRGRTLMDLDIEKIQSELKREAQISFARVSRQFPATLKVELHEKKPILRLCLRSKTKGEQTWLIDSDGFLYQGSCYSHASLIHLPFLNIQSDMLKPLEGGGYEKLHGVTAVSPLLELVRKDYPGFYKDWQIISYQRPHQDDAGAHIHVKSRKVRNLRFAPHDFANQLRRLKYLLSENDFRHTRVVESIDLSHDRSVFAKLSTH